MELASWGADAADCGWGASMRGRLRVAGWTLVLVACGGIWLSNVGSAGETEKFSSYVDAAGGIRLPDDFRKDMVHLGSWFVPEGGVSGFHDVYTEANTVEAYRRTGAFPDGATIVMELRASTAGDYTTGPSVRHANDSIEQWFVMIKDRKGRFPESGVWGEGWGWALIKPDDPSRNLATSFRESCLGCHLPAKSNDWIYIEAYPTLRK
jgi:hypothetical protein